MSGGAALFRSLARTLHWYIAAHKSTCIRTYPCSFQPCCLGSLTQFSCFKHGHLFSSPWLFSGLFLPAGARERLVLRLLYVSASVCLFVCLFVRPALITYAIYMYYVIRYYATAVYSSFWRFAGQATANEGSFVLPRWRKLGR